MCGIVGYVGVREAEPILVDGLRRLEYRGYDSAGVATLTGNRLHLRKKSGRVNELTTLLAEHPAPGTVGISHTRWATHGAATDANAHPHVAGTGPEAVAVVHNGVIENYSILKRQLEAEGIHFQSQTDTEVVAQLIAYHLNGDLVTAVRKVLKLLKGTYGLAVVSPQNPDQIIGARLGSPLVVGVGEGTLPGLRPVRLVGNTARWSTSGPRTLCPDRRRVPRLRRRGRPHLGGRPVDRLDARGQRQGRVPAPCSRRSTNSPRRSWRPCATGWTRPTRRPTSAA